MMGFLQPCLLLQLVEKDLHGYDLLQGLDRFMSDGTAYDPSIIYRLLKAMEADGLVSSYEGELSRGPRRKMYTLSAAGWSQLRFWRNELEKTQKEVELVLALYEKIVDRADPYRTGD